MMRRTSRDFENFVLDIQVYYLLNIKVCFFFFETIIYQLMK